jgi:hypothetical protein
MAVFCSINSDYRLIRTIALHPVNPDEQGFTVEISSYTVKVEAAGFVATTCMTTRCRNQSDPYRKELFSHLRMEVIACMPVERCLRRATMNILKAGY